ncbi:unnamed protein product [Adineta ricciae]|uniref:Ionotropic glutamate receptor C-terminal domain-containing protein n=1 Tax=Adineta ricciae TaxID=249248 RepID=A0A814P096_ADIRI|nr:unnamed protein product [Adineta ricciae]CAF1430370.1 unnamed protein product [Adineta ricciae]
MQFWNVRYIFLLFVYGSHLDIHNVKADWPSLDSSNSQLLGLFPDAANATNPSTLTIQARAMFKAAVLLSQQYNIRIGGELINWRTSLTGGIGIDALSSTCHMLSDSNIVGIVGPALSRETPIVADFAAKIGIPVVSYAATAPELSSRKVYPTLYRTIPSDYSAALAIVKLFVRFNWNKSDIVYQNDAFGTGGAKIIEEAFLANGLSIENTIVYDIGSGNFKGDFRNTLTNSSSRIILLWATSSVTEIILQKALFHDILGPRFTWILSTSISFASFNQSSYSKLIGILTIEPVVATMVGVPVNKTLLNAAYDLWKTYEPETYPASSEINYYALFAFDAAWLLIQSLHKLCSGNSNNLSSCVSFTNPSVCFDRRFLNTRSFLDTINNMSFLGVSGLLKFDSGVTDRINGSYYYAQNIDTYAGGINFIPVLGYSDANGWERYAGASPIIWPDGTLTAPSGVAKLNGVHLRIGVIISAPFTILTTVTDELGQPKQTVTGYMPDLIALLQDRMGFIPDIQVAPTNFSYTTLIQAVASGLYDIVVGDVTVTSSRREIVDFSNAIYDNSLRIVMARNSETNVDFLSFLKPFSSNLWLMALAAMIVAGVLFAILERSDNEILQQRSTVSLLTMSIWYSFGNIVGYGADFEARTGSGRLITAGLYLLSVVLVVSYTANLASDLTLSRSRAIISGLDDVKSGKIPFNRIGIRVGSASEDFYLREVSNGRRNYYALKNKPETYACLLNGSIDLTFMDVGVAEYITNNVYCSLTLAGEEFNKGVMSIVTPKQWIYKQELDINILALREAGELDRLKSKWVDAKDCPAPSEISTAMEVESMVGLFLVFAVICLLSVLLSIWKKRIIVWNYISRNRKEPTIQLKI